MTYKTGTEPVPSGSAGTADTELRADGPDYVSKWSLLF
jgi:hypothetical protein